MPTPLATASRHAREARIHRQLMNEDLAARDEAIVEALRAGATTREVAEACELDRGRVSRIGARALGYRSPGRKRQPVA